jgi:hypothetical protein
MRCRCHLHDAAVVVRSASLARQLLLRLQRGCVQAALPAKHGRHHLLQV